MAQVPLHLALPCGERREVGEVYALLLASLQRGERGADALVLALAVEHERCAVLCLERSDAYHCLLLVGELERTVGGCYG